MNFTREQLSEALKRSYNLTEFRELLNIRSDCGQINTMIRKLLDSHALDYSHLKKTKRPTYKWLPVKIACPVCAKEFLTRPGHPREKKTCSYSCSNKFFRTGENHPNFKHGGARKSIALIVKASEECSQCKYSKMPGVLQIHHKDRNRFNNNLSNLELLCPNCHMEEHYTHRDGVYSMMKAPS